MDDQKTFSDQPVFIIGNPRSGTTLLRLMLTCHPNIAVPPEGKFIIDLCGRYEDFCGEEKCREQFVQDVLQCPKMEYWNLDRQGLDEYIRRIEPQSYHDLVEGVYEYYTIRHQPGKVRWGDKNNIYLRYISRIGTLFPRAQFVHIVRDGRDVACSYRDLSQVEGRYAPNLPGSVIEAARHWHKNIGRIRASFETVGWDRVHEIRYEDLILDTEVALREMCTFLGEPYSEEMLAFAARNAENDLEPREFDAWKARSREALDPSRVQRWRKEMFTEDVALFESEAGGVLKLYGYETTALEENNVLRGMRFLYGLVRQLLWPTVVVRKGRKRLREIISKKLL